MEGGLGLLVGWLVVVDGVYFLAYIRLKGL